MRSRERSPALAALVLPLVAGMLLMSATLLAGNWDTFYPRYLYPTLPGFALFAALALRRALPSERLLPLVSAWLTGALLALWGYLTTVPVAVV